jgi:hypothetical protein
MRTQANDKGGYHTLFESHRRIPTAVNPTQGWGRPLGRTKTTIPTGCRCVRAVMAEDWEKISATRWENMGQPCSPDGCAAPASPARSKLPPSNREKPRGDDADNAAESWFSCLFFPVILDFARSLSISTRSRPRWRAWACGRGGRKRRWRCTDLGFWDLGFTVWRRRDGGVVGMKVFAPVGANFSPCAGRLT